MSSDKCSAERGKGYSTEWCFRTAGEKWGPKMVATYKKAGVVCSCEGRRCGGS
jgi:hypothetical protein